MKKKPTKKSLFAALTLGTAISTIAAASNDVTYNNMFISYVSPQNVTALRENIVNPNALHPDQPLRGYILWEVRGDANPVANPQDSLLRAANPTPQQSTTQIMGYWTNWSIYTDAHGVVGTKSYPIPGSYTQQGSVATNQDLLDKLPYLTILTYSFLEAQTIKNNMSPQDIGTLYFFDPNSDLTPSDSFCTDNSQPLQQKICSFVAYEHNTSFAQTASRGNFSAFSKLINSEKNQRKNFKGAFSVGGYSHDASFESIFDAQGSINQRYADNFVNSAGAIVQHYKIDTIDLDYENPTMTHEQSQSFAQLIDKLSSTLPAGKDIQVTIMASPAYLRGTKLNDNGQQVGFAPGVLANIASQSKVSSINLMTYDFHGAFDYDPNNSAQSVTGLISNNFLPTNTPEGYQAHFSINRSVQALLDAGVAPNKISVGIPAYGRSLANIAPHNYGLFQPITKNTIIPRGNVDSSTCLNTLPFQDIAKACSGSFTYTYILHNMIKGSGATFTPYNWTEANEHNALVSNGTTAYATSWTVKAPSSDNYKLTIKNSSPSIGIEHVTIYNDHATFDSGYIGPNGTTKVFDSKSSPPATPIEGEKGLSVAWSISWLGKGTCPGTMDLTADTTVSISVNSADDVRCNFS